MMRSLLTLTLTLLLVTNHSHALTEGALEAAQQLKAAMNQELKADGKSDSPEAGGRYNARSLMIRIMSLLETPEAAQLPEMLNQIATYFSSEEVHASVGRLQKELKLEQEIAEKAVLQEIQAVTEAAGAAVRSAKTPADLDATLVQLAKFRQRGERQLSDTVRMKLGEIESAHQFVSRWQDYLAAHAAGQTDVAQAALRELSNNRASLIPRSEILAKLDVPKRLAQAVGDDAAVHKVVEQILAKVQSLDNLTDALKELREVQVATRGTNAGQQEVNAAIQNLQPLEKSYQDFRTGLSAAVEIVPQFQFGGAEMGSSVARRLRSELLLLTLPHYIGAPEAKAAPEESVVSFLDRMITDAKERGNIQVATRAREALRLLQRGRSLSTADNTALSAFISGQNQEEAGQYMLAVISYQKALQSGSDLAPAKVIGERLEKIKAEHSKEFAEAMERVLNPPPVSSVPPSMMERSRSPFGRPQPVETEVRPPALLIPPAPVSSNQPGSSAPTAPPAKAPPSAPAQ